MCTTELAGGRKISPVCPSGLGGTTECRSSGTPDASSVLPKWIMHPMPDVRLGGVVSHSRFLQVAPYVKVSWS